MRTRLDSFLWRWPVTRSPSGPSSDPSTKSSSKSYVVSRGVRRALLPLDAHLGRRPSVRLRSQAEQTPAKINSAQPCASRLMQGTRGEEDQSRGFGTTEAAPGSAAWFFTTDDALRSRAPEVAGEFTERRPGLLGRFTEEHQLE